jgi:hypothetical protein
VDVPQSQGKNCFGTFSLHLSESGISKANRLKSAQRVGRITSAIFFNVINVDALPSSRTFVVAERPTSIRMGSVSRAQECLSPECLDGVIQLSKTRKQGSSGC